MHDVLMQRAAAVSGMIHAADLNRIIAALLYLSGPLFMQEVSQSNATKSTPAFMSRGGVMGALMRAYDWENSPLGSPFQWPQSLCTAVGILLHSKFPMFLFWGDEHYCFYNDAYRPSLGKEGEGKHPCIGKRGKDVWPEIWHIIHPQIEQIMAGGEATWHEDQLVPIYRNGKIEDAYWTYSYSHVFDEEGRVAGGFVTCTETTQSVKALADLSKGEQVLKESKERLQAALDASLTGTFRWDIQTNDLIWDENLDRLFGLPPGKTVQSLQSFIERVHQEDRQGVIDRCRRCAEEGADFEMEFRVVWPDGSLHWLYDRGKTYFNEDGLPMYMTGACVDITENKESNHELRVSKQRFEAAISAVQGVLWTNNARGEMEGQQPGWNALTGQSYEEYQGYGWSKALHPDDAQPSIDAWNEAVREKKTFVSEHRVKLKNGEWGRFSVRAIPLLNDDGSVSEWVGVHTNITEQRLAEANLQQSEEQFRTLSNAIPQLAWMTDENGLIYWYNQRWYDYTGTTLEEMQGWGWTKVHHPAMIDGVVERFQKALDAGLDWEDTFLLRSKDGEYRWFLSRAQVLRNPDGSIRGWFGSNTDITEQRNAAQALAESESRFRTLANDTSAFMFMADGEANVEFVNRQWLQFVGLASEEGMGQGWQLVTHPDDIEHTNTVYSEAVAHLKPYELLIRQKRASDEAYRWIRWNGIIRKDNTGKFAGVVGVGLDITEQKQFTDQLEKIVAERTRELQRSNEDLQQFAHVASHDLKEPVRKVITFQNLLRDELGNITSERAQLFLHKIEASSLRIYSMIEGILAYSTLNATVFTNEPVDLEKVLNTIEDDLEVLIMQKGAVIRRSNLPVVQGSPVLLYQLFYNLIINSLKFTKPALPPVVSLSGAVTEEPVDSGLAPQRTHQIIVQDNGIGFTQEDAEKIFQLFSRLNSKDKYEGTGLGLSLCKKIVERHGGTLRADGQPGLGATFTVYLPA